MLAVEVTEPSLSVESDRNSKTRFMKLNTEVFSRLYWYPKLVADYLVGLVSKLSHQPPSTRLLNIFMSPFCFSVTLKNSGCNL
ncbi:hypothetical protein J7L18_09200, partial [Candidatus Bathyarchaeota archaeon]|nr:hypothetical protein [Candidatus Bathyarchaeota archaeon]